MGDSSLRATVTCDLYGRFIDCFLVTFLLFFEKKFQGKKSRGEKNLREKILEEKILRNKL